MWVVPLFVDREWLFVGAGWSSTWVGGGGAVCWASWSSWLWLWSMSSLSLSAVVWWLWWGCGQWELKEKGDVTCHTWNYDQQTCACGCMTSHDVSQHMFICHVTHHICSNPGTNPVQKSSGLSPVLRNIPPQESMGDNKDLMGPLKTVSQPCIAITNCVYQLIQKYMSLASQGICQLIQLCQIKDLWLTLLYLHSITWAHSSTSGYCISSAIQQAPSTMAYFYYWIAQCWWVIPTNCPEEGAHNYCITGKLAQKGRYCEGSLVSIVVQPASLTSWGV